MRTKKLQVRKKPTFVTKTAVLLLFVCIAGTYKTSAQTPCDMTPAIIINTGYNPVLGTTIPLMSTDPIWQVTQLSADCMPYCSGCSTTVPNPAIAMPPLVDGYYSWATNPASQWITFNTNTGYPGYPTVAVDSYSMTLTRIFRNCTEDDYQIEMDVANDNSITNMNIDGTHFLFSEPITNNATYFNSFAHLSFTVHLSAGTHYLNVSLVNYEPANHPSDDHGLNIVGTISSVNSNSSLVSPVSDPNCCCSGNSGGDSSSSCKNNSVSLSTVFSQSDKNNNCVFNCVATTIAGYGWTPVSYKWYSPPIPAYSWPGLSSIHYSSSLTDAQTITTPNGSSNVPLLLRVTLINAQGDSCQVADTVRLDCSGGKGLVLPKNNNSTGINTPTATDNINIFPNPTNQQITITASSGNISKVQVLNIEGKLLKQYNYMPSGRVQMSLDKFPSGTYIIKVNDQTAQLVNKIK